MTSIIRSTIAGYQPAYQTVAIKIAELIAIQELKPGDRLPSEQQLGLQFGVSRTVVREAVKVLMATSQVQAKKGSGLYVCGTSPSVAIASIDISLSADHSHIHHLFEFRVILEESSVRMAANLITHRDVCVLEEVVKRNREDAEEINLPGFDASDAEFHLGIAKAGKNPFLIASIKEVMKLQSWAINIVLSGITPGSLRKAAEQHEAIIAAIKEGNEGGAIKAMRLHLSTVEECYEQEVRRRLHSSE